MLSTTKCSLIKHRVCVSRSQLNDCVLFFLSYPSQPSQVPNSLYGFTLRFLLFVKHRALPFLQFLLALGLPPVNFEDTHLKNLLSLRFETLRMHQLLLAQFFNILTASFLQKLQRPFVSILLWTLQHRFI